MGIVKCAKCHKEIKAGVLCSDCVKRARDYSQAVSEAMRASVRLGPETVKNADRDRGLLKQHKETLAQAGV